MPPRHKRPGPGLAYRCFVAIQKRRANTCADLSLLLVERVERIRDAVGKLTQDGAAVLVSGDKRPKTYAAVEGAQVATDTKGRPTVIAPRQTPRTELVWNWDKPALEQCWPEPTCLDQKTVL